MNQDQQGNPFRPDPVAPKPNAPGSRTIYTKQKQKKPVNITLILTIVFGALGLCFLGCICAIYGLAFWGANQEADRIRPLVENSPEVKREIGDIVTFRAHLADDNDDLAVSSFKAVGSNGKTAIIRVRYYESGGDIFIESARIENDRGIDVPLTLD